MNIQFNKLFHESRGVGKKRLRKSIRTNVEWNDWNPIWSDIISVIAKFGNKRLPFGSWNSLGVYFIIYLPTGEIMYVGNGYVWKRKGQHTDTCLRLSSNKEHKFSPRSRSRSNCGQKMYDFDKNIKNWGFQFCVLEDKELAKDYEDSLRDHINPPFNVQKKMTT
tara:strand:- start:108 stop:599 length:492 start_codon:yes stop_codon:yes gene_type:complete